MQITVGSGKKYLNLITEGSDTNGGPGIFVTLYTLRQNGLLPRKNVTAISNIVQETTCPQGPRTGFG